jgi:hypothetical protein
MKTLDHWTSRLATVPSSIECPSMRLMGRDHEPPIFTRPGHVDIRSSTSIDFTMFAPPAHPKDALRRLKLAAECPYGISHQFRLFAIRL